ncbi:GNAT family N-acetyltransferase [Dactylosporangium sp. NPDC048998]|uniref:GNAT family N-acetyltransferase n=1 Tax=Dactylosporangium sp. NPDC048998 TaxID=3363976 RepID=UPI00371660FA
MSLWSGGTIRTAGLQDATAVGDVLAAALTDTALGALLPVNRTGRRRVLRQVCTALAAAAVVNGGTVHVRSDVAGAAIWLPADTPTSAAAQPTDRTGSTSAIADVLDIAVMDLDTVPAAADGVPAAGAALNHTTQTVLDTLAALLRPTVLPRRGGTAGAWFLVALGVDPDARREGVARQLLTDQHDALDRHRAPAVAVAIDPAGQQLYATAGYRPHHVDPVADGLAVQWLVRSPGPIELVTPRPSWRTG